MVVIILLNKGGLEIDPWFKSKGPNNGLHPHLLPEEKVLYGNFLFFKRAIYYSSKNDSDSELRVECHG